jgi:hypothetical protein
MVGLKKMDSVFIILSETYLSNSKRQKLLSHTKKFTLPQLQEQLNQTVYIQYLCTVEAYG